MTKNLSIKSSNIFPIRKLKKKNAFIPEGTEYFQKFIGVTKQDKNYKIINFLSKKKNPLGKEISFIDKNNKEITVRETFQYYEEYKAKLLDRFVFINDKLNQELHKIFYEKNKYYLETNADIKQDKEVHSVSLLQKGKKPKSISYTPAWNGERSSLNYKNIPKAKLGTQYLEYLPIWLCDGFSTRFRELINHIFKIQEKNHKMPSGIIPEPVIVKHSYLNSGRHNKVETMGQCDPFSGEIAISNKRSNESIQLLKTIAHEYQHAVDISDCMRLEENVQNIQSYTPEEINVLEKELPGYLDFFKRSLTRGIIKNDTEQGKMLMRLGEDIEKELTQTLSKTEHDDLELEDRAIKTAEIEEDKIDKLITDVFSFFSKIAAKE